MIILDTNVLSEFMEPNADARVVSWLDRQPISSVWTTSVTLFEIRYGLEVMPAGKRRDEMLARFEHSIIRLIQQRVAILDAPSAAEAAKLAAARRRVGRVGDLRDTLIAGIVMANRGALATRNARHFEDIKVSVVNPWET